MKGFLTTCAGLILIIIIAITLQVTGHPNAAWFVGNGGPLIWFMLIGIYIAVFDSRSRWPNTTVWDRAANVITFKR